MAGADTTQLYVVVYDIPDDKRRTKVHKLLCGYGMWTQFSLFECWLTRRQLLELRAKLGRHLLAERDNVRIYRLCAQCQRDVVAIGGGRPEDPVTVIL